MPSSIWDNFTKKYSMSKTLCFELKPVGNTEQMLIDNNVFKKDQLIQNKYERTKPYFDRLHRKFITESLENFKFSSLVKYFELCEILDKEKSKENEKKLKVESDLLRKEIVAAFASNAKKWKDKYKTIKLKNEDYEILFEEDIFAVLKEEFGKEEDSFLLDEEGRKISIFDSWKGFTGYFTKFFETRKNFYKADGTSTAVATRIVDQNLRRFCKNFKIFDFVFNKVDLSDLSWINQDVMECFKIDYYSNCLTQEGIDRYNEIIGGKTLEDGRKLKGVNECINKYRQDHKGEKLPFLKTLDKQIGSEKKEFFEVIENDQQLIDRLKVFALESERKVTIIKKLFSEF